MATKLLSLVVMFPLIMTLTGCDRGNNRRKAPGSDRRGGGRGRDGSGG
jgi:hypothetical protein